MEKRGSKRYPFRVKAKVQPVEKGASVGPMEIWTHDVGPTGLLLELNKKVKKGTRVELTFQLPPEVTGKPVLLSCLSRVVRVTKKGGKIGVGVVIESYEVVKRIEEK